MITQSGDVSACDGSRGSSSGVSSAGGRLYVTACEGRLDSDRAGCCARGGRFRRGCDAYEESWATAANNVCRTGDAAVRKLPKLTAQTYLADLSATLRIAEWADRKLAVIPRPPSELRMITSFLATSKKVERVQAQVGSALVRGDKAALKPLLAEAGRLDTQYNHQALALGARVCAQSPTPSG